MKSKKRKIPMRVRRRIFYTVCIAIVYVILMACLNGCDKELEPVDIAAADTNSELAIDTSGKVSRYSEIHIEEWEIDEMAAIIYLEARNQSAKGQQAVAEVILNRVLYNGFPDTVYEVIHEDESKGVVQFTTVKYLDEAKPTEVQYKAINAALYGEPVLPLDVVFFSGNGENDNVWGKIDDHIFCYAYKWEQV